MWDLLTPRQSILKTSRRISPVVITLLPGSGKSSSLVRWWVPCIPVPSSGEKTAAGPEPEPEPQSEPEPEPATPRGPSAWRTHLQPFFVDNWYIVVGLLMLLAGCSLVAYYTWNGHWLWRYTLLPAMLGGFTFGLAGLGTWIENRQEQFRGTAASLRGAAVGLLPVNFITVVYLADEEEIGGRILFVLLGGDRTTLQQEQGKSDEGHDGLHGTSACSWT